MTEKATRLPMKGGRGEETCALRMREPTLAHRKAAGE